MEKEPDRKEISDFYNSFCEEEKDLRLNIRHYTVFQHLVQAGLQKNHSVLEIGCGFGTITSLMAKYVKKGKIIGTDISAERIASCQRQFKAFPNVSFVLTDMKDFEPKEKFDFIVLPDVLEHIPLEDHQNLFGLMSKHLKEDGQILIHLPHPLAIEYLMQHNPSVLQIIDQAVHSDALLRKAYSHNLILHSLNSYSLTHLPEDYQLIIFRKRNAYTSIQSMPVSSIRWRKTMARIFFWKKHTF